MKYLAVSTKSGGPDPSRHSILSLDMAVVDLEGTPQIIEEAEVWIAEPTMCLAKGCAAEISEHVAKSVDPWEAVSTLQAIHSRHFGISQIPLVGWNAVLQQAFVRRLVRIGSSNLSMPWTKGLLHDCPLDLASIWYFMRASRLITAPLSRDLDDALRVFNVEETGAKAIGTLFIRMLQTQGQHRSNQLCCDVAASTAGERHRAVCRNYE